MENVLNALNSILVTSVINTISILGYYGKYIIYNKYSLHKMYRKHNRNHIPNCDDIIIIEEYTKCRVDFKGKAVDSLNQLVADRSTDNLVLQTIENINYLKRYSIV